MALENDEIEVIASNGRIRMGRMKSSTLTHFL